MFYRSFASITLFSILGLSSGGIFAADPTAFEIIQRMIDNTRGDNSRARISMTIKRPRFERTLVFDAWETRKDDNSFIRLLKPQKDKGITFLKKKDNLWQYIPRIGREIKIEGSLMQDSWMGSDFTNDDLVQATSYVDDFTHTLLTGGPEDQFKIKLVPKPGAAVVWQKIVAQIRKTDLLPARYEFYDHKARLKKVMQFDRIKTMGGRRIPSRMTMSSIRNGKEKSRTQMEYIDLRFNTNMPNYIFSRAHLRK